MCARFTVLSETPIASAIAGCAIPLSRSNILNALPLSLGHFPVQRRLQLPNLAFRAFDHPSLPKQMATGNHTTSLRRRHRITANSPIQSALEVVLAVAEPIIDTSSD